MTKPNSFTEIIYLLLVTKTNYPERFLLLLLINRKNTVFEGTIIVGTSNHAYIRKILFFHLSPAITDCACKQL